jgi:hypothetical protein
MMAEQANGEERSMTVVEAPPVRSAAPSRRPLLADGLPQQPLRRFAPVFVADGFHLDLGGPPNR